MRTALATDGGTSTCLSTPSRRALESRARVPGSLGRGLFGKPTSLCSKCHPPWDFGPPPSRSKSGDLQGYTSYLLRVCFVFCRSSSTAPLSIMGDGAGVFQGGAPSRLPRPGAKRSRSSFRIAQPPAPPRHRLDSCSRSALERSQGDSYRYVPVLLRESKDASVYPLERTYRSLIAPKQGGGPYFTQGGRRLHCRQDRGRNDLRPQPLEFGLPCCDDRHVVKRGETK